MSLNLNIKQKRLEMKLTLQDVADQLGVTRATVQKYESGAITKISLETVERLSEILNVTPSYLMGWDEQSKDEVSEYLDYLHKRPEMRMLFSVSKNATKADIEKAVKIIEALKDIKE